MIIGDFCLQRNRRGNSSQITPIARNLGCGGVPVACQSARAPRNPAALSALPKSDGRRLPAPGNIANLQIQRTSTAQIGLRRGGGHAAAPRTGHRPLRQDNVAFAMRIGHNSAFSRPSYERSRMEMTGSQTLPVKRQVAWDALNDPEILKASITGCDELTRTSDTEFATVVTAAGWPGQGQVQGQIDARRRGCARVLHDPL